MMMEILYMIMNNYKIFNLELKITNSINENLIYFKLILNENDLKIIRI